MVSTGALVMADRRLLWPCNETEKSGSKPGGKNKRTTPDTLLARRCNLAMAISRCHISGYRARARWSKLTRHRQMEWDTLPRAKASNNTPAHIDTNHRNILPP
jgi:hypothetical protein